MLIAYEWEERAFQTRGRRNTFLGPYVSGWNVLCTGDTLLVQTGPRPFLQSEQLNSELNTDPETTN